MNSVSEFVVGSSYSNDQIRFSLRVGNLGGVRPSTDEKGSLRHIAIMTSTEKGRQGKTKNPYKDLIEGDILVYTASGRKGDQLLSGSNKRVTEQYAVPVPIFGFINKGQQVYEYLGLLELVRHYQEEQIDGQGSLRKVWIFEFRIHNDPSITPLENASAIMANLLAKSRIAISATGPEREVIIDPKQDRETTETQVLQLEEVRAELLNINPYRFEYLVKELIENCGFNKVQVTKSSGDGGIDLNAVVVDSNDFFSGTFVQFQVKRWRHSIGSVEINNFRGAMHSTAKGVFVTTSHYTLAAIENAANPMKMCISLIDGHRLASMLIQGEINLADYLDE